MSLNWLLVFIPTGVGLHWFGANPILVFVTSVGELIAIVMAVYLARTITYDGESSWLEGLILIGLYVLFGIVFFYHP